MDIIDDGSGEGLKSAVLIGARVIRNTAIVTALGPENLANLDSYFYYHFNLDQQYFFDIVSGLAAADWSNYAYAMDMTSLELFWLIRQGLAQGFSISELTQNVLTIGHYELYTLHMENIRELLVELNRMIARSEGFEDLEAELNEYQPDYQVWIWKLLIGAVLTSVIDYHVHTVQSLPYI